MVKGWWEGHDWPGVPPAALPRLGVVASVGGVPAAAAWLYMDNSVGVAMLEWIVTNPNNSPRDSIRAIRAVTEFLKDRARDLDYGVILTTCKQQSLLKLLERNGFQESDRNMFHAVAILN